MVAENFMTTWEFHKALYEKYGGRNIFQQFCLEPIDAFKEFREEVKEKKYYEVYGPKYFGVFNHFDEYFKMGHNYFEQEGAQKYFNEPYWTQP